MDNLNDTSKLLISDPKQIIKKTLQHISIPTIISFIFFALSFSAVIYYITGPAEGYLHSDCTDSLLWAYATVESGEIIAQDFYYAALLPFSSNLWMIPIVKLLGYTMKAQTISMIIFAVLFTASLIWLLKILRLNWALNFTATGCILMLLSSSDKMREIMWGHVIYYSLALLLINCLLSISIMAIRRWEKYYENKNQKDLIFFFVYLVLLAVIATGTATNGIQIILMTTIPVFVGIAGEIFFNSNEKLFTLKNIGRGSVIASLPFFSLVGLAILGKIKGDVEVWYTNYYSQLAGIDSWETNLFKFHKHFLTLIGFNDSKRNIFPEEGQELLADTAIYNVIAIGIFILLMLIPLIAAFFYKKYKHKESKIAILSYITLLACILFLFICGNISNVNWRLVPIVGASLMVIFVIINELLASRKPKEETDGASKPNLGIRISALIIMVFVAFAFINRSMIKKMPKDYGQDNTLHVLTEILNKHGLDYGFATFWYSQAITLLSDNEISCRDVHATAEDGIIFYEYQTFGRWYEPQEGVDKYFVILNGSEYSKVIRNDKWQKWTSEQLIEIIDEVEGFYIFVFDGYLQGIK